MNVVSVYARTTALALLKGEELILEDDICNNKIWDNQIWNDGNWENEVWDAS